MKYVYEFTNKRKLTRAEFLRWFQKKFLYTIRRFNLIARGQVIGYENKGDFQGVVLEDLLKMFADKSSVELVKLPSKKKINKKAISFTLDREGDEIVHEIIKGKIKEHPPIKGKIIKPLYLFLDKEVLLYAKLKKLKFKNLKENKDNISFFINELEEKHPEIKSSIIASYFEIFS